MIKLPAKYLFIIILIFSGLFAVPCHAGNISDNTYLITKLGPENAGNADFWRLIGNNKSAGIEMSVSFKGKNLVISNSGVQFSAILDKLHALILQSPEKIVPVFINYNDNILLLDSVLNQSIIASSIFYLPQGEAWPAEEYLKQANRRVIFFVEGQFSNTSRILHSVSNYALQISASEGPTKDVESNYSQELMVVRDLERLPVQLPGGQFNRNLVPDYINFLLENWKRYGKRPNFLFVGNAIANFSLIVDQLNSFTIIKGVVKFDGKKPEKIYWKNPDIQITGGSFSFPYRGGEEITLTPFLPGYQMTPEHLIITSEMAIPESYQIFANQINLIKDMKGSFRFENEVKNDLNTTQLFEGSNFSIVQDVNRGNVLRLPENASINLGKPENYGLRNSSFTAACFVKFTEILDFGDNAILGNYESGYRRGLHLILRSGHPYFGLWANDYVSAEKLKPNEWYHLTWRYIIETGEQSIFLNGKYIGGSDGHPPFSGTGDIHLGSALSSGASLRGYIDNLYIWNRPLGNEEINRLSLDENILSENNPKEKQSGNKFLVFLIVGIILIGSAVLWLLKKRKKSAPKTLQIQDNKAGDLKNRIELFGEFRAFDQSGADVSELFTPKVKELFLFVLIQTQKTGTGASVSEINEALWSGISPDKVANNRSVTLNKLRKLLQQFDRVEITSTTGHLQMKMHNPFYCDFASAYKLCQIPGELNKSELVTFFEIVKRGSFLKGIHWPWLDEIRGFTGNQVIDILLNLATIYQKENNLHGIEKIARRILDYDDLNEEAIYLQVWALQKTNNLNMAKFSFSSFTKKYEANLGEPYPMTFQQFNQHFDKGFN